MLLESKLITGNIITQLTYPLIEVLTSFLFLFLFSQFYDVAQGVIVHEYI